MRTGWDGDGSRSLRVDDVWLSFGATPALRGASLEVRAGEIVALVGASGSGKSTLLHCAAGLLAPESGSVTLDGVRTDALSDDARSRLRLSSFGFVFQHASLVPELTAQENVELPLRMRGWSRTKVRRNSARWLRQLDVESVSGQRPGQLSGGQAQRVAACRALAGEPQMIFADEPTGALDQDNSDRVVDALTAAAREQGASVLLVTHDHGVAARADRQVRMVDGSVEGAVVQARSLP